MFRHKPRVDEIPDFKGFLIYLQEVNPELHGRYMKQLKKALIADIMVFVMFIATVFSALLLFNNLFTIGYLNNDLYVLISVFIGSFIGVIISSVFGRKGHSKAIEIESEIVVEYHHSGFRGV
ncbi:MAG: hypothetical protein ACTSVI_02160 [Promethearchaeota archaeon]